MSYKFWMVYNPGNCKPTVRHPDEETATSEAKRLAANNPGETFVVLESIHECTTEVPAIVTVKHEHAPRCD